jgi:hypothetical protein
MALVSPSWRFKPDTAVAPTHAPARKAQAQPGRGGPPSSVSLRVLKVWRLTCLNGSQSAPQMPPSCTPHLFTPARPRSSEQVSWITVRTAALKIARPPQAASLLIHARPRMSGTLNLQPVSHVLAAFAHDPRPKTFADIFGGKGQGRGVQTRASASTSLERHVDVCWLVWGIAG